MMKISLITTLATLLLLFTSFSIATGEQSSQIIVYKAKKIPYGEVRSNCLILEARQPLKAFDSDEVPVIDGKIKPGEWNDASIYNLSWWGGPYGKVSNDTVKVTLCLKHDSVYLYVLFIIRGVDIHKNEELRIVTGDYWLYLKQNGGFIQKPSGDVEGKAAFSYMAHNQTHIFEIKLKIDTYFSTRGISPFNIIFVEDSELNWAIVPIGGWNNGEPGILLL